MEYLYNILAIVSMEDNELHVLVPLQHYSLPNPRETVVLVFLLPCNSMCPIYVPENFAFSSSERAHETTRPLL